MPRVSTHLITYCTETKRSLLLWELSARQRGWESISVVGLGSKWRGWSARAEALAKHVAALPPGDKVLITDGYDVLVLQSPEMFVETLGTHKLLLGTENSVFITITQVLLPRHLQRGLLGVSKRLRRVASRRTTINGGAFAGTAEAMTAALHGVARSRYSDDQAAWAALADGEETCGGLLPSDFAFDTQRLLVYNFVFPTSRRLLAFAFAPRSIARQELAEARRRNSVCIHVPGCNTDGFARYTLVAKEELGDQTCDSTAPRWIRFTSYVSLAVLLLLLSIAFLKLHRKLASAQPTDSFAQD